MEYSEGHLAVCARRQPFPSKAPTSGACFLLLFGSSGCYFWPKHQLPPRPPGSSSSPPGVPFTLFLKIGDPGSGAMGKAKESGHALKKRLWGLLISNIERIGYVP